MLRIGDDDEYRYKLSPQYFPNKDVTGISVEPTYYTLHNLHKQIKSNAASVPSALGGGQHEHLGLVLVSIVLRTSYEVHFLTAG